MTPDPQAPGGVREALEFLLEAVRVIANDLTSREEAPIPSLRAVGDMLLNIADVADKRIAGAALAAEPAAAGVGRAIAELTDALAYVRAEQKAEREGHAVVPAVIAIERRIAALKETK